MGYGGDQVEDWASACSHSGSQGGTQSLFWASFFLWPLSTVQGTGPGTGLSWTRMQAAVPRTLLTRDTAHTAHTAPLWVLDVAHTRAMTVKVCVHSPKHYLNEDMTTDMVINAHYNVDNSSFVRPRYTASAGG